MPNFWLKKRRKLIYTPNIITRKDLWCCNIMEIYWKSSSCPWEIVRVSVWSTNRDVEWCFDVTRTRINNFQSVIFTKEDVKNIIQVARSCLLFNNILRRLHIPSCHSYLFIRIFLQISHPSLYPHSLYNFRELLSSHPWWYPFPWLFKELILLYSLYMPTSSYLSCFMSSFMVIGK